jgi:Predicted periplasmic protein (DUF2092)
MRRALLAGLVAALAVAAVGCGGAKETLDPVASAAENGASAGGFHVQMAIGISADGVTAGMTGSGAVDGNEGELTFDLTEMLAQGGLPAGMSGEISMITLEEDGGAVFYMKIPFLGSFLPEGKQWIRVDAEEAANAGGIDLDQLMGGSGSHNPAEMLAMLRAAGEVEEIGPDVVDGVETTHYRATIDLQRAIETRGVPAETAKRMLELVPTGQFPVEVWIGTDDDLPYKLVMAYDMTEGGETASMSMTMTMSDWGSDVSVEAPPADEVFDATAPASQGTNP